MIIEHFGGKNTCDNLEELERVLSFRTEKGVNEFWLNLPTEYPCMNLVVKNNYASLLYIPEDGHPGFISIGHDTDLDEYETSTFYTNTDQEEISVANYTILPFSIALNAVKEFFETKEMPKLIEWEEL